MKANILIVDSDPGQRELLTQTLENLGFAPHVAADLEEACRLLRAESFQLCLTAQRLPDGSGLDLLKQIRERQPRLPCTVITARGDTEAAVSALRAGAFDFLSAPVDPEQLRIIADAALKLHELASPPDSEQLPVQIVGESDQMRHLKVETAKVARSQAPVFIHGEPGSGKELVARAIHYAGPRRAGPFVAINCGAIPVERMESEFFGHRRGSFPGAAQDKTGLFQAAQGGTLFLDDIGELPLHLQVKLLHVLQDKRIRPLGSDRDLPLDLRLISATHRDLGREVERGRLRQDLYEQIRVVALKVPPLRECRADIPLLARYILERLSEDSDSAPPALSRHALNQLMDYDFPGNVRELENLLRRASALAEGQRILAFELPRTHLPAACAESESRWMDEVEAEAAEDYSPESGYSLERHLESVEKEAIRNALEESGWNKTEAARKLGISFRSFRYRIKKYDLD